MKTQARKLLIGLSIILMLTNAACSKSGGGGDSGSAAGVASLTITPSPATVTTSGTLMITPHGGTAPYTFSLLSSVGGSLSTNSGVFTIFTAGATAGTAQLSVTSANGLSSIFTIFITGGSSTFTISPLATSVAINGAVPFTASGGTPPYTYTVLTAGGGYFQANTYYAPGTAKTVTVQISDSAGHSAQTTVTVTGTTTGGTCAGNYSLNLSGYPGTMTILQNTAGAINGSMTIDGGTANLSGTCVNGTINFTNNYSGSPYTGYYMVNPSNAAQTIMSGTFQWNGGTYSWFASSY